MAMEICLLEHGIFSLQVRHEWMILTKTVNIGFQISPEVR